MRLQLCSDEGEVLEVWEDLAYKGANYEHPEDVNKLAFPMAWAFIRSSIVDAIQRREEERVR
jgi:hypothetical protein